MIWLLSSIISMILFTILFLCYNKLKSNIPISIYMFYISIISGITILFLNFKIYFSINDVLLLVIAGILSWAGTYFYNKAMFNEKNLGFIEAIFSIRIPFIYFYSIFLFNGEFSLYKLFSLLLMIIGNLFVNGFEFISLKKKRTNNKLAIRDSFISSIATAGMTLICKHLMNRSISPESIAAIILIITSFFYFISNFVHKKNWKITKNYIPIIIIAIITTSIGNILMFQSYNYAPNLSYVTCIISFRMVLLYIISIILKYDNYNPKKAFGIILCFISICSF